MSSKASLVFFSGKMGAGKSTVAKQFTIEMSAILISEDEMLARLYPEEINEFSDYIKYSARLKFTLEPYITQMLSAGLNVVLDFPANTQKQRLWFKTMIEQGSFDHKLVYLKADDELCLQRIGLRRTEQPKRAKFDTEAVFKHVTRFFEEPLVSEGFKIDVVTQS